MLRPPSRLQSVRTKEDLVQEAGSLRTRTDLVSAMLSYRVRERREVSRSGSQMPSFPERTLPESRKFLAPPQAPPLIPHSFQYCAGFKDNARDEQKHVQPRSSKSSDRGRMTVPGSQGFLSGVFITCPDTNPSGHLTAV